MPSYSDIVKDHFHNPRNTGVLEDADGMGTEGKPGGGPYMQIYVKLHGPLIAAVSFLTYGCAAAIASCSRLSEMVKGLPAAQALKVTPDNLTEALGGLPLGKQHCPRMAVTALAKAIEIAAAASHGKDDDRNSQ